VKPYFASSSKRGRSVNAPSTCIVRAAAQFIAPCIRSRLVSYHRCAISASDYCTSRYRLAFPVVYVCRCERQASRLCTQAHVPRNIHPAIEFGARPGIRDVSMQAHFLTSRLLAGVHRTGRTCKFLQWSQKVSKDSRCERFPPVLLSPRSSLISMTSGRTRVSSPERPRGSAAPRIEP
jgi:hypothetical protein